jgi:CRISPR-associated endoribonuclease Cas6
VRRAAPALADALHGGQTQRPFTVSNLLEIGWPRKDKITLSPGKTYTLRITGFSPQLSALLRERLIPELPPTITLADVPLQVTGNTAGGSTEASAACDELSRVELSRALAEVSDAHPWACTDTFEALVQRHTLSASIPPRVGLRFASPTLFRSEDMNVPLPLPGLVFGGLLDKWNAFAPLQLPAEVRCFAQECLAVSRYRLETRRVAFGEDGRCGTVAGCVGDCSYAIRVKDKYWMGLIHLLAAFAFYAGVGRRTTMGLGQCRALGAGG